jgi:hypothetical protein
MAELGVEEWCQMGDREYAALAGRGWQITLQLGDRVLAGHRDCEAGSRREWLDPDDFAFARDLSRANDFVVTYHHSEAHTTMCGNSGISLEQHAAEAYVVADGLKLRNSFSQAKLYVDWIAQAESTIAALLSHRMSRGAFPYCHCWLHPASTREVTVKRKPAGMRVASWSNGTQVPKQLLISTKSTI